MECDRCGACCRQLMVEIDDADIAREPRLAPPTSRPSGSGLYVLAMCRYRPCPLQEGDLCSVYETRPAACSAFEAGSPNCQRARYFAGLPPLGSEEWTADQFRALVLRV